MTATITTLPHYFPDVFAFRVILSVLLLSLLIFVSYMLYKNKKTDKVQFVCLIALSCYMILMLYHTVIGRYSQSYYRFDGRFLGTVFDLITDFNVHDLEHLVINLLMMVPISFLLMMILRCRYKTLLAFDLTALLVITIELLQFFTRAGTLQYDDIIYNFCGAMLGILFYYLFILVLIKKRNEKT